MLVVSQNVSHFSRSGVNSDSFAIPEEKNINLCHLNERTMTSSTLMPFSLGSRQCSEKYLIVDSVFFLCFFSLSLYSSCIYSFWAFLFVCLRSRFAIKRMNLWMQTWMQTWSFSTMFSVGFSDWHEMRPKKKRGKRKAILWCCVLQNNDVEWKNYIKFSV